MTLQNPKENKTKPAKKRKAQLNNALRRNLQRRKAKQSTQTAKEEKR